MVIMCLPVFAYSQKAFEAVYYSGKTQNIEVKFTLADGYIEGCEIKTTDLKTKKTSRFLPDFDYANDDDVMKFYHYSRSGKTFSDYFLINGLYDYVDAPAIFSGTYYFKGKAYDLTLTKL